MHKINVFARITATLFILFIIPEHLYAQIREDSAYLIAPVEINGYRYKDYSTGSKSLIIDSAYLQHNPGNLSDVLSNQSAVYIKNYGPSGIASISMRGGSASQTQTTMNGIVINSPTLGQSDFAIIPSFLFNTLSIQYGSQVTLMGSGAIGGSIHLSNEAAFIQRKSIGISYQQASFGSHLPILSAQIGNARHQLMAKVYFKGADNNITYYNNTTKETLSHADQRQGGIYIDYSFIKKHHTFKYWVWYQQMHMDLPGTLSSPVSYATQFERNFKQGLQWKYALNRSVMQARLGWQNDKMSFNSGNPSFIYTTLTQVLQLDAEYRYSIKPFIDIMAGAQMLLQTASSDNFANGTARNKISIYLPLFGKVSFSDIGAHQNKIGLFVTSKIRLFRNRLEITPSIRKEWCNQQWIPITPSLGLEYHIIKVLTFHALTSYNYRIATLNDLYYNPGGNPNLKPEEGWSYESGLAFDKKTKSYRLFQDLTVYTKTISDWIQWLPPESGINWTPINIQKVWSRGLESESVLSLFIKKQTLTFKNSFAYTKSTNVSTTADPDKQGKQLIYVPLFKNSFMTSLSGKVIGGGVIYNYTSWSFTASDNTDYVNPYNLFDIYGLIQKTFHNNKYNIVINARINNLFNTNYQVVMNRPMPLRNYQLTITLNYN